MKYLDAKEGEPSPNPDNKMLDGTRADQQTTVSQPVRDLAKRLNVDLNTVKGTGKNGTITTADVQNAADSSAKTGGDNKANA